VKHLPFFLQWTLTTIFAFFLSLLFLEIGERPELATIEGVIGGAIVGGTQYLLLRRHLPGVWLWLFACIIGWGLMTGSGIGAIGWVAPRTNIMLLRTIYGFIFGSLAGILVGTMQWLALRSLVRAAWCWLIASPLCWGVALALGWTVAGWLRLETNLFLFEVVGLTVTWLVVGATTGVVMSCLLGVVPLRIDKSEIREH